MREFNLRPTPLARIFRQDRDRCSTCLGVPEARAQFHANVEVGASSCCAIESIGSTNSGSAQVNNRGGSSTVNCRGGSTQVNARGGSVQVNARGGSVQANTRGGQVNPIGGERFALAAASHGRLYAGPEDHALTVCDGILKILIRPQEPARAQSPNESLL